MTPLTDIQYQIINSLYFVEPFDTLVQEVDATEPVIVNELRELIDKRYVQVMMVDETTGEKKKSFYYDSDNMRAFSYVATGDGISLHSQR